MARKPETGGKSSINPQRQESTEIRAKLLHGHREYKMIRLRELIEMERKAHLAAHKEMLQDERDAEIENFNSLSPDERVKRKRHHAAKLKGLDKALKQADNTFWRLPDNYLSARLAAKAEIAHAKGYVLLDEIDTLWRDLRAQFERAVLDGTATFFERQDKAIRSGDTRSETDKARDGFDAEVARALEMSFWKPRAEANAKEQNLEPATLTPAGKQLNFTGPQQVLDKLGVEKIMKVEKAVGFGGTKTLKPQVAYVGVCGCRFASERRAREAVEGVRKLLGYEWNKASDG